jgi:hypothetical protein
VTALFFVSLGLALGAVLFGPVVLVARVREARARRRHLDGYGAFTAALHEAHEAERRLLAAHEADVTRGDVYRRRARCVPPPSR